MQIFLGQKYTFSRIRLTASAISLKKNARPQLRQGRANHYALSIFNIHQKDLIYPILGGQNKNENQNRMPNSQQVVLEYSH